MPPIRVLICDDAVVVRRLLSQLVEEDDDLVVAATAAHGRIALAKITQSNPDVVVLDVEMPEMDGLETLRELRKDHPGLPVIMFSTLTERGAATTLDALTLGADDFVTKPANVGSVGEAMHRVRTELIPKIKALASRATASTGGEAAPPPATERPGPRRPVAPAGAGRFRPRLRPDVIAIGASTGGPNALATVLAGLRGDLPAPVVITQHMPPLFTRLLAERLDTVTELRVAEGHDGAVLAPGQVWVAPGDHHLFVRRRGAQTVLATNQDPPENSCRPAVDVMFRSVAQVYGARTLGVVLTGMGKDGLRGVEHIVEAGGRAIAQDEATSVVWGMPGFVARADLAEDVLPIDEVAPAITACFGPTLFGRSGRSDRHAATAPGARR